MTLLQSQEAIGAVTKLLQSRMSLQFANVAIGRPETAANSTNAPKLNLFLYRVAVDGHLRNHPLDRGQQPPIWLVLHYLMTAFDESGESDSIDAHRLLGRGMAALQELNFLRPSDVPPNSNPDYPVLKSNPDSLKITFDDADVELLSKIMQGSDEKYRVSAAFQVRPVMILPEVQGSYAPLVKTVGPPITAGADVGTGVMVLPNLGPQLDSISPSRFTAPTTGSTSTTLTLHGTDLSGVDKAFFGSLSLMSVVSSGNEVTAILPPNATLPPGAYPVTVSRPLTVGHVLSSNAVLTHVLPKLDTTTNPIAPVLSGSINNRVLTLSGDRLGGPDDSIFVGLYQGGELALIQEAVGVTSQNSLTITVIPEKSPLVGSYLLILRVNGEQADDTLTVNWS